MIDQANFRLILAMRLVNIETKHTDGTNKLDVLILAGVGTSWCLVTKLHIFWALVR